MTSWAKKKSFIYLIHFQFRFRKQSAPARHNLLHVHGLHHAGIHPLYLPDQGEGPAPEGHTHDLGDGARRQHGHLLLHRRPGRHDSVTNGLLFRIPPSGNRHRTLLSLHRLPQVGQVDWLTATEVNGSIGKYKQVKKMEARLRVNSPDTSLQERAHPRESPCHGQQLVPRAHEPHDVRRPLGRQQRRRGRRQEAHLWRVHRRPRGRHVHREGRQITAV